MKQIVLFSSVLVVMLTTLVTGCSESSVTKCVNTLLGKEELVDEIVPNYNIVLIADGTDLKHNQYATPEITVEYVLQFAEKIQQRGKGRLWLGYVDNSSENNKIAYLEIFHAPHPVKMAEKMRSETKVEYDRRLRTETERFVKDSIEFEKNKSQRLSIFLKEAQEILQMAYSDKVATAIVGSDVNGAINASNRILKTMYNDSATKNFIALISDGVDNIKHSLNKVPDNIKVLLVNNSGSKNHLGIEIVELDNLSRMEEYIFSNK